MTKKTNQDQSRKKSGGLLPFLGGAVAGAAAVFLSKKENRDKAKETMEEVVEKAKELKEDAEEVRDEVASKTKPAQKQIKENIDKVKKAVSKTKTDPNSKD
jgi:gas vesicle protein